MRISISGQITLAISELIKKIATESYIQENTKQLVNDSLDKFEDLSTQKSESDIHRAYYHPEKLETRIEIDDEKLLDLIAVFYHHRTTFIALINIISFIFQSWDSIKAMLENARKINGLSYPEFYKSVTSILSRPSSWSDKQ